jgi:hypothetical protein
MVTLRELGYKSCKHLRYRKSYFGTMDLHLLEKGRFPSGPEDSTKQIDSKIDWDCVYCGAKLKNGIWTGGSLDYPIDKEVLQTVYLMGKE